MIKLTEEYRIAPNKYNTLRHFCHNTDRSFFMYGIWIWDDGRCYYCNKVAPKKILFMYKLWRWQNDRD